MQREPLRSVFNPHGFTDSTHLFNFLNNHSAEFLGEVGEVCFLEGNKYLLVEWEQLISPIQVDFLPSFSFDRKFTLDIGIVEENEVDPQLLLVHKLELLFCKDTIFILSAKTLKPGHNVVVSLNVDSILRVLLQNGYYSLPVNLEV